MRPLDLAVARCLTLAVMVTNGFADLCVRDMRRSVEFYTGLLGLEVLVDHGWYAELGHGQRVDLALVRAGHETVPAGAHVLASFEVDDVSAMAEGRAVVRELGQRHFMTTDPDGTIVDVIQRVDMTAADLRRLVRYRRSARC